MKSDKSSAITTSHPQTMKPLPRKGRYATSKKGRKGLANFTEEEIQRGLLELAICGGSGAEAARRLKDQGHPRLTRQRLRDFARRYADRYAALRDQYVQQVFDRIATESEDLAIAYADAERQFLAIAVEKKHEMSSGQAAGAAQRMAVSKGINIDKASIVRGRPTQVVQRQDMGELVAFLERAGVAKVIEAESEELPPLSPPEKNAPAA